MNYKNAYPTQILYDVWSFLEKDGFSLSGLLTISKYRCAFVSKLSLVRELAFKAKIFDPDITMCFLEFNDKEEIIRMWFSKSSGQFEMPIFYSTCYFGSILYCPDFYSDLLVFYNQFDVEEALHNLNIGW